MARNIEAYIPDYLRGFDEIVTIAEKADYGSIMLASRANGIKSELWFDIDSDGWEKVLRPVRSGINLPDMGKAMCYYCPVVTINELNEYVNGFLQKDSYKIEYDHNAMRVNISVTEDVLATEKVYKALRKLVPMNLELTIKKEKSA